MNTLHKISLFLAFCLASIISVAQTGSVTDNCQSNIEHNPSSASARQIEYQLPQPSLVTGAVNFNIPLYTIDVEGFTLPFSLSYHSSGIKPFDDPFPCGYGWTIQPALKITRIVRGRPDEFYDLVNDPTGDLNLIPSKGFACMFTGVSTSNDNTQERLDTENDIFKIALPSGIYTRVAFREPGGKYTFVGANDDNEIAIEADPIYPLYMRTIKVTDEKGVIYRFGGPYESTVGILNEDNFNSQTNRTSWCLKEIELPSGRTISFTWKTIVSNGLFISGGDVVLDSYDLNGYHPVPFEITTMSAMAGFYLNGEQARKRLQLSSVSFPGGNIDFSYDNERFTGFKVTASGNTIEDVSLTYGEGKSNENFLKEVSITDKGDYKFEYNDCNFYDTNARLCQDWWGYYNGRKPQGNNYTLTPLLKFKCYETTQQPPTMQQIGYADRRPDEKAMQSGLLKMATYPTGATTKFEYETHRFPKQRVYSYGNLSEDTDPYLNEGGGLRVKRIVSYVSGSDSLEHRYSYDSVAVVAVPSAATFVSETYTLGLPPYAGITSTPFILRLLSFGYQSDYMRNHIGLDPIWYPKVTEYFAEGKIEYTHDRMLPPDSEERQWGLCVPQSINNALGKGARLTCKKTFKQNGNHYDIVETQSYEYELTAASTNSRYGINSGYINNFRGTRILVQSAFKDLQGSDFTNGETYRYSLGGTDCLWYLNQIVTEDMEWSSKFWTGSPYRFYGYSLALKSDRLKSKTVTRHLENGDFTQTETYEYKPGTSIITSVVTTTSNDTRTNRIDLTYAAPSGSATEKGMVAANMIGVPVQTKHTFGNATTTISHEMANYGNRLYLPSKTYKQRGAEKWLVGEYDYDSFGNLREYKGEDGIPTSYLWGYGSLHLVYKIIGAAYSQVKATSPGSNALNGSAELTDLTSKLNTWLTTRTLWKPLVGVSSQREPNGMTSSYQYDSAGRLVKTAIDGHGPVNEYTYHINENGLNYHTSSVFTSATSKNTRIREIINYDGLGRESTRLSSANNTLMISLQTLALDIPLQTGFYATLTEYDAMDRPYRSWSPVRVETRHPDAYDIAAASGELYGDSHAYSTTYYEPSPLATVTGSRKAGQEWHDADRRVTVRHLLNTASGDHACLKTEAAVGGLLKAGSYYPEKSLLIEEVTDEEGHVTMTFKDLRGLTVMTREGKPGDWNDTRYVYNDYGDLLNVIQPLHGTSRSVNESSSFSYKYDARGNCVSKTFPGGKPVLYRYDSGNRLFAEQDGNMRRKGQWLFHFYDRFGRQAVDATASATAQTVDGMRQSYMTATPPAWGASIISATGGYTISGAPSGFKADELIAARYYDSYDFAIGVESGWASYTPPAGFESSSANVRGLETGVLASERLTVTHYDRLGRPVRVAKGRYSDFVETAAHMRYDYEGHPVEEIFDTEYGLTAPRQRTVRSYFASGLPCTVTTYQDSDTAITAYTYDDAGRVSKLTLSGSLTRTMAYNANGWLTSAVVEKPWIDKLKPLGLGDLRPVVSTTTVYKETLHYADAPEGCAARYDGKISARKRGSDLTAYGYDCHGRLASSKTVATGPIIAYNSPDYSTEYCYDRNANITSLTRKGVTDIIGGRNSYGLHSDVTMSYSDNRLISMNVDRAGADYEGRTGVSATGDVTGFYYDDNGNLDIDPSRGIFGMDYNHQNQPTDIYMTHGQKQHITYDGLGNKLSVEYLQVPEALIVNPDEVYPIDSDYHLQSRRDYVGPHVFCDGKLEYSAFWGGYFDPDKGTMYYIADWQGNNAAVIDKGGNIIQQTIYYPYGEPTIEPTGQRYLFGGKEREHAGGRNSYDFGARCLTPYGRWGVVDPEAERYYPISTYAYCGGDPINRIDRDGKVVIFINGFHFGSGGSSKYWEGIDSQIMGDLNDNKAMYYDGSIGGWHNLAYNLYSHYRHFEGMRQAYKDAGQIFNSLNNDESIKFVSHSMGASYTKGFIYGLKRYAAENNIDVSNKIEFELDLAPFQADKQIAHSDVPTTTIMHINDGVIKLKEMDNANNEKPRRYIYPTLFTPYTEHGIKSFKGELNKIRKTYFAREDEN